MAGLIAQQRQAQQQQQAAEPVPQQAQSLETEGASDEVVARVVEAGRTILYDEKGFQAVMQQLQSADDPAAVLADVVYTLMVTLDEKSGATIPEDALIPAAVVLLEELAQLANDAGVMQVDEDTVARAMQELVALAIENGVIDAEEIEALRAEYSDEELQAMLAEQERIATGGTPAQGQQPQQEV